jgi:hypothetical protein
VSALKITPDAAKSDPTGFEAVPPSKSRITVFAWARGDMTTSASAKVETLIVRCSCVKQLLKLICKGERLTEFSLHRMFIVIFLD